MTTKNIDERLAEAGLRLPHADMTAFETMVADAERIATWLRGSDLTYADEPATCFAAPKPQGVRL